MNLIVMAKEAKQATFNLLKKSEEERKQVLLLLAKNLRLSAASILAANQLDVTAAKNEGVKASLIDRLALTEKTIEGMARSCEEIATAPQVVGKVVSESVRPNLLKVKRVRIPLGVILMIFEGRPNVVIEASALAIKSGNAILLKGGKEAFHSNRILASLVTKSLAGLFDSNAVQLIETRDREELKQLLSLRQFIDLVIPRGGEKLIEWTYAHSQIPVIAHFKGLCHLYIHQDADLEQALSIAMNAKVQRPGVCNAMETLLINEKLKNTFLPLLIKEMENAKVELRVSDDILSLYPNLKRATDEDWDTEYLDKILSVKLVPNVEAAILHIQHHGSGHTEAICAKDLEVIQNFKQSIVASCVMVNASTRFNDGGELGLGAELGIATSKLHAYGPMGAEEMTITRFEVEGKGQIRT